MRILAAIFSIDSPAARFSRLPKVILGLDVSVSVVSPRRKFGEIETYHWWDRRGG
jgi:hypothetical protein